MPFTLADHVKVQARFLRGANDVVMNTFTFATNLLGGFDVPTQEDIRDRLDTFYAGLIAGQVAPIMEYLAIGIPKPVYYMRPANAAPGVPGVEVQSAAAWGGQIVDKLPPDVAMCISYRGVPPALARQRGRIYVGPLSTKAKTTAGLISAAAINDLSQAAVGLSSVSNVNPVRWVIASEKFNQATLIGEGYVDEHFDTQRRRDPGTEFFGRRPSTWFAPPA